MFNYIARKTVKQWKNPDRKKQTVQLLYIYIKNRQVINLWTVLLIHVNQIREA
jgi:hypothetical protein